MKDEMSNFLYYYNTKVIQMIADKYAIKQIDAMRKFVFSETYQMMCDPELAMWDFSPFGIFDMWEVEQVTGNPRNSLYIRRD